MTNQHGAGSASTANSANTDGLRLAIGTFTRIPVAPPGRVDRASARIALLLAPGMGLLVGLAGAAAGALVWTVALLAGNQSSLVALLAGVLSVIMWAWFTRALHLDGTADLADAMGVRSRDPEVIRGAMRAPAIGAFGVVSVVAVMGLQAVAVGAAFQAGIGPAAAVAAAILSRAALPVIARRGTPARVDGLGAAMVGAVGSGTAALVWLTTGIAVGTLLTVSGAAWYAAAVAAIASLGTAEGVRRFANRRLHAVTGDALGSAVEYSTTVFLVALVIIA